MAAVKYGRFHTGSNGYCFAARRYPHFSTAHLNRDPSSASSKRSMMAFVSVIEEGYAPRHSEPCGNTDRPTGVIAW